MTYTAILLAGSRPGSDPLVRQFRTDLKALVPIAGEPMVVRPVRALLASTNIRRIVIAAQPSARLASVIDPDPRLDFHESKRTIAETLMTLIDEGFVEWPLLVTTADHALLDTAMIDEFCAGATGTDVTIGVVSKVALKQRLPETKRTWLRFRDGAYTGANLFALSSATSLEAIERWRAVEQDRKKAWRLISTLGPAVVVLAALRLISLDRVLARLGARLGLTLRALRLSDPLAGVDVDKPTDHVLVEAILAGRA